MRFIIDNEHTSHLPHSSIRRWLFTTNHKDIGLLYLVGALYFLIAGGILAILVRAQLAVPNNDLLLATTFNQAVTMHGLIMVLWFLSPLAFALANYFVPLQIGAKDMAFPRLNALSFWLFLFSGLLASVGFFTPGGAIDTGWTVYAPLSTTAFSPQVGTVLGAAGLLILVASITLGSINFIVTILHSRAPGLKLLKMPMFTWSILFTVLLMLVAFPALAGALLMLASDRLLGTVYFSSIEGGSVLWTHLFWFFGHPEVYIVLFPAIGVVAEIVPTFTRRPLYGKKFFVGALAVATGLSMIVWVHHMFLTGVSAVLVKFMTITTEIISIPFGIIMIALILTMIGGSLRFKTPMLFALGSMVLFIIGGITGVFNSSVALDYGLRGTYWIVGHFHYTMVGGGVTGLLAALYWYYPKMTGRMFNEKIGKLHFALYFVSFNLLYFPMHYMLDLPRRVSTYSLESGLGTLNLVSSIATLVFAFSMLLMFINFGYSLVKGKQAGRDPWGAWGLEWTLKSPPPEDNFDKTPTFTETGIEFVQSVKDDAPTDPQTQNEEERAETHLSYWPILIALGASLIFLGIGLGLPILLGGLIMLIVAFVGWAYDDYHGRFVALEPRLAERWPFAGMDRVTLGVWVFLVSEVVLFGALISAIQFVRGNSATWPLAGILNLQDGALGTFILITSGLTLVLAIQSIKAGNRVGLLAGLLGTFALGLSFLFIKAMDWVELIGEGFTFSSGLPASTFFVTTGAHGVHIAGGLIILLYLFLKASRGKYTSTNHRSVLQFGLYWGFVDIVWIFLFPLFYLS